LLAFQAIFKEEHLRIGRSLLKKSFVEFCGAEKRRMLLSYSADSHRF
jgi:hypothetical protein